MMTKHKKAIVIGAGPMGLMAAHELQKKGCNVTIYERDDRIGGMSASFEFAGTSIERFYHFICKTDQPIFDALTEFGIEEKLRWSHTSMGFYYHGKLYPWGTPIRLLTFPKLSLTTKLRYGVMAWKTTTINDWTKLDKISATTWLKKWIGAHGYETLWNTLFHYKFYEHKDELSAAWLGTRIKRVGLSRKNIFQEEMGYLEGGSEVLLRAMQERIFKNGGEIHLDTAVHEVLTENNKVIGVKLAHHTDYADVVISTVPLPVVPEIIPNLSETTRNQIHAIKNVGVACVLFKMKKPLSKYFWVNINDPRIELPGVIEYSNLNPTLTNNNESILYVPYYMPHTHEKYCWSDAKLTQEAIQYLRYISTEFHENDIMATQVTRYAYSQTVCGTNFLNQLPPMRSSELTGFYMADTSYYYPEDRSISESFRTGSLLATLVHQDGQ